MYVGRRWGANAVEVWLPKPQAGRQASSTRGGPGRLRVFACELGLIVSNAHR